MKVVNYWNPVTVATLTACLLTPIAFAQSDLASVAGVIHDPSGAVIPGDNVTVKNQATGFERKATTNDSGFYSITNVAAGTYTLIVEVAGFKRFMRSGNAVSANVIDEGSYAHRG